MTDSWFTHFPQLLCLVLLADGCGSTPEAVPPPLLDEVAEQVDRAHARVAERVLLPKRKIIATQ